MAWFRKEKKPRRPSRDKLEIPADAWDKCDECGHVDLRERFERVLDVCPECGYHRRILAAGYVDILTDDGSFKPLFTNLQSGNPLGFEAYADRLARAYRKTGPDEGIITGEGTLEGTPLHLGVMQFAFMGGSMGSVVGEKIARLAERSYDKRVPLVIVSRSGGARMQEGVLSLMQMAKTSTMIAPLKEEGIPFISILTDPTTGGVSASFAMQGDINIAEPGAVIGFTGARVIKQTIGQDLPEGFQTAEFLLDKGMVDVVVPRPELRSTTARLLKMMLRAD
ncbi:MAG: acetyl-CoA carboxylase, carboxyltransferase subunit beta [Gemmatimonadota bacterium]|nr:acetyl-CoA carboxylase, carboxyltransferase subunit beta [Gemmatimonadota bacterium]MDH5804651.1 acetyl-CoA carboxylase, carboxyltransferase subunit beta [Gemmatimonadota bacterium]